MARLHERDPGGEPSIAVLEPDSIGAWQITTETGSRYRLHLPSNGDASVTHLPAEVAGSEARRDGFSLRLFSWQSHRAARGADPALLLGDRLILVMEPLSPGAEYSVRITSPVTEIQNITLDD